MTLYIQHGHGKSDKIEDALSEGFADGVIFAARNEKPEKLESYVEHLRSNCECELLFDPQFFVSTFVPPNDRYLPEYPYYQAGRSAADFIRAAQIQQYVKDALDFQVGLGFDRILSPSVMFSSFTDRWNQIALSLADASLTYHSGLSDPPPLLISFVLTESALASRTELDSFLDVVTSWDMEGVYLVVSREDSGYSQRYEEGRLANLLYLVYVLGELNGFSIILGYTDFVGILLSAVGAEGFATGWHLSLRRFHRNSFLLRKPGGQQPRLRYSTAPLFNSMFLGELQLIAEIGQLDRVLSGVTLDDVITRAANPEDSDWNLSVSQLHHWETLQGMSSRLSGTLQQDLPQIVTALETADGLYTTLKSNGVPFDRSSDADHLAEWLRAIRSFRNLVSL